MAMHVEKIYVGGWFQRTTLHLSEIYDFLTVGESPLALDKAKVREMQEALSLSCVELKISELEYIHVETKSGFDIDIFEDGLIVLGTESASDTPEVQARIGALTSYYEKKLSPALSYIFSLGAPMPKELANIKTIYPYFLVVSGAKKSDVETLLEEFHEAKHFEIQNPQFEIYRGDKLYVILKKKASLEGIRRFIEEQIFIREFKGQLHRYLNLHRTIWERIAAVKERGEIRGKDVPELNTKIESYAKTINLIGARINQMSAYLKTRESIAAKDERMQEFTGVLRFKHEELGDTLVYIKEIWAMTKNYVEAAQKLFVAIQAKSTEASVKNLTIITSMGVGATLIGLFAQKVPTFTVVSFGYFFALVFFGFAADKIVRWTAKNRMYKIEDADIAKDL